MRQLQQQLAQQQVVEGVLQHVGKLRKLSRACIERTLDPNIQNLLWVVDELLNESSDVTLSVAIQAVSGHGKYPTSKPAPRESAPQASARSQSITRCAAELQTPQVDAAKRRSARDSSGQVSSARHSHGGA